jgi:hypothetical protein
MVNNIANIPETCIRRKGEDFREVGIELIIIYGVVYYKTAKLVLNLILFKRWSKDLYDIFTSIRAADLRKS